MRFFVAQGRFLWR